MNRAIISVVGKDRVGIIAAVCTYLADHGINILDINQSISQGFFHMMMITDITASDTAFASLAEDLDGIGKNLGVQIKIQREDIFDVMHQI